ncbi:coA-transferase family III domain-containing protein [Ditylenchus destructor]|uniref:CoA-transferase family III domain-containing protein n=1 Tax=Ditylenchus destructor TaxID=166010 RepID=A0AAD4MET1_9BILA|nr:coA-transferase family III domain-containing protein [Ditylenchus destructor]
MTSDHEKPASLEGLRILDLSRILAGPTAAQLLADLGAQVIKVERPGAGDDTRGWGPPFVKNADGSDSDLSAYFLSANRNKQSISIDLASDDGVALVKRLAAISDVVIENYKPGDLARRGLGYDDIRKVKPDIVWCAISGFGQTGPYADRTGYDFLIQAMGGIMSITGDNDANGGRPVKVGLGIADVMCGMYATVGILAALRHRDRSGEGQYIDLALYDAQVAWLINAATNHLVSGKVPGRIGNRHPNIAPYQTFATADGEIAIAGAEHRYIGSACDRGTEGGYGGKLGTAPHRRRNSGRPRRDDRSGRFQSPYAGAGDGCQHADGGRTGLAASRKPSEDVGDTAGVAISASIAFS